jgi:tryptophan synthase alpha chain
MTHHSAPHRMALKEQGARGFRSFLMERRATRGARKAFIPYFTLGDPDEVSSLRLIEAALSGGADALELGFPFSDPIADGPVIQRAAMRALLAGTTTDTCFLMLAAIRERSPVPMSLLVYYNLIHAYGIERFCGMAAQAGVGALLVADLPLEESGPLRKSMARNSLQSVFMVGLNTPPEKMKRIIEVTTGYLYLVAVLGVTGERQNVSKRCIETIETVRGLTSLPLCVGFGISSPEQAGAFLGTGVDGIIVGSAVIRIIEESLPDIERVCQRLTSFVRGFTGRQ